MKRLRQLHAFKSDLRITHGESNVMRYFMFVVMFVVVSVGMPVFAAEEHFDIWLRPVDGRIMTGSITEGTPGDPLELEQRVFGAELGEDALFPYSTTEPGIQALASPETAGMVYSFTITGELGLWNSDGFDSAAESMLIEFGPASAMTGAGEVQGFSFNGASDGLLHDHFDFTLLGPPDVGDADPLPGIYVLSLTMSGVNGASIYESSPPFWIVFNLGMDEREHDAAMEWVQANLAPGPGGWAIMLPGTIPRSRKRRV